MTYLSVNRVDRPGLELCDCRWGLNEGRGLRCISILLDVAKFANVRYEPEYTPS